MEKNQSTTISSTSKDSFPGGRTGGFILAVIVLCALSFYGGVAYQKGRPASPNASAARGGFGAGFRARRGGLGTVTSVNSSSITVQNQRTGTTTTYNVNGSTQITKNGSPASLSSIQLGDLVLVRTPAAGSTTATSIDDTPGFGSGGTGGSGTPTGAPAQST